MIELALGGAPAGTSYVTSEFGGGITQVDVVDVGAGDGAAQFTFYYVTSEGVGGPALLEAFVDADLTEPFFTLEVDDKDYSFTLHDADLRSQDTVNLGDLGAVGFEQLFLPQGAETIGAGAAYDVRIESFSNVGTMPVNTSEHGLVGGEHAGMQAGDAVQFEFARSQTEVAFDVTGRDAGAVTLGIALFAHADDPAPFHVGEVRLANPGGFDAGFGPTVFLTQGAAGSIPGDAAIVVEHAFSKLIVTYTSGTAGIGYNNLTYDKAAAVDDFTFNFDLTLTDLHGETATLPDALAIDLHGGALVDGVHAMSGSLDGEFVSGGADDVAVGDDAFTYDAVARADAHIGGADYDVLLNFVTSDSIDLDALFDALGLAEPPAGEPGQAPGGMGGDVAGSAHGSSAIADAGAGLENLTPPDATLRGLLDPDDTGNV